MDVTNLSLEEAEALLGQLYARLDQLKAEADNDQAQRGIRIEDSIDELDALLGPEDSAPGTDSINAVLGYDGETMAANAHIALPLTVSGLKVLTLTVKDIASYIANKK